MLIVATKVQNSVFPLYPTDIPQSNSGSQDTTIRSALARR